MAVPGAATELDVANLALANLGEPPVGSLADNVTASRTMAALLGVARDKALIMDDWDFATAWIIPTLSNVVGIGPRPNRFPMPADCVRVRRVIPGPQPGTTPPPPPMDPVEEFNRENWAIEAAMVNPGDPPQATMVLCMFADTTMINGVNVVIPPYVSYTRRIIQPSLWDAEAIVAWADVLAAMAAPTLLKDPQLARQYRQDADKELEKAARSNAREGAQKRVSRNTSWVRSRLVGLPAAFYKRDGHIW